MDESHSLDALANILNEVAEKPFDIALHARHIRLAQSIEGMEEEVLAASEILPDFLAAGEDVWLRLIKAKEASVNLESTNGVEEVLALYARAENDYLSIPILQKHLEFIIDRHALYSSGATKPAELGDSFSTEWTRTAIVDVVNKGKWHLTKSYLLWDMHRDWELEILEKASPSEKPALVEHTQSFLLTRLRHPHSNTDDTFQSYSSFTTNYKPPQDYESLLVAASKIRSQAARSFERRERHENALVQSKHSLESYAQYIAAERGAKKPDLLVLSTVYERAIAEAARRRFDSEPGAEEALRAFWSGYCDALRINQATTKVQHETFKRAVRSVPGSGEVWARYIRYLERGQDTEDTESVADIYDKALSTNIIQADVEQVVPLVLARAGYEKRRMEAEDVTPDSIAVLNNLVEAGIDMVRKSSPTGDPRLRLEKFYAEMYVGELELPETITGVWKSAAKHYKTSYLAWTSYTDALIKIGDYDQARSVFKDLYMKNIDWPEAIWEAWILFEHLHGSLEDIEACYDKVEKAQFHVNAKRAKEAEQASYRAFQMAAEQQAATVPVADAPVPDAEPMEVDQVNQRGAKRTAEDEMSADGNKRAKTELMPPPLKRDRENSTVFVADLPAGVTEDELSTLFKDCGKIREVKITSLPKETVATVEFFERDSVPPALTKDKKRVRDTEVAVHLAWKSTLYITNFPEKTDDAAMRELFGKYGTIFDVRWPSKKFKSTRRFCYVQFTSPASAQSALELHGRELEPDHPLSVLISNPERKKERTDHDANDREVYVAGLSKFTTKSDLETLFKTYGGLKEIRMATNEDGSSKGFAFVEFEQEKDALTALGANNYELKKRRIAVTLADARVHARNRNVAPDTGFSRRADTRNRSVRVRNLPPATQEGLLHQALEKIAPLKRVEVFVDEKEAVVEFENAAEAGKLLLRTEPITFNGHVLQLSEEGKEGAPTKAGSLFLPRTARPKAGLGHARKTIIKPAAASTPTPQSKASPATEQKPKGPSKGQDHFRKMLG